MEDLFFDRANYDLIYNVLDEDLNNRYGESLVQLPFNAGEIIYNSMLSCFQKNSKNKNVTLTDLNRDVLTLTIPELTKLIQSNRSQSGNMVKIADQKIDIFKENYKLEDIEGSLPNKSTENINKTANITEIEYDLDLNSSDRKSWIVNGENSAYHFVVNFGVSDTFPGIGLPLTLKNVKAIEIGHVILPDADSSLIDKYPFLYLQIEELPGMVHSTSDKGRQSLVKLVRDKKWEEISGGTTYTLMTSRGNNHLPATSTSGWYSDNPVVSINKMTINILTPNGFSLPKYNDVFNVGTIAVTTSSDNFYTITLEESFFSKQFIIGNRIGFKEIDASNSDFITYLMNNEHIISGISMENKYINIQKIPVNYNSDGTEVYTDYGEYGFNSAKCMNLSIQSSIGFNIKSIKYESSVKQQLN